MGLLQSGSRRVRVVAALALVCVVGCGAGAPKTVAVTGTVAYKVKGEKPKALAGSKVRLQGVADQALGAHGEIEDDGTFTLNCFIDGKSAGGVIPGEYRGRIEPPGYGDEDTDDGRARRARGVVNPRYLSYDKSGLKFTIGPDATTITIEVEK